HAVAPPPPTAVKIVIAPDAFKESLSAPDAAAAIARGIKQAYPGAHTVCIPMADGGEGTVAAVLAATGGQWRSTPVRGALGEALDADWGWLPDATAIIEMAAAAGLEQTPPEQRDPLRADSHGVGQLVRAALDAGARRIILGLGGSATNDGGTGLLRALGVRFLDAGRRELPPGGAALAALDSIDTSGLDARLADTRIEIASDVDNPLCGPHGASHTFGPQKGASPQQVAELDASLARLADVCARHLGRGLRDAPGAGAAGGLGVAADACPEAPLRPRPWRGWRTSARATWDATCATRRAPARPAAWGSPRTPSWTRISGRGPNWWLNWAAWRKPCRAPRWPSPAKAAWTPRPCAARRRRAWRASRSRRACR